MKAISTTEMPMLTFTPQQGEQKFHSQATKIGWMRAMAEKPGISFDITIKDGMGRVRAQRQNCKTQTNEFGELINLPTLLGEDLNVEVSNLKGTDKLTVFLN